MDPMTLASVALLACSFVMLAFEATHACWAVLKLCFYVGLFLFAAWCLTPDTTKHVVLNGARSFTFDEETETSSGAAAGATAGPSSTGGGINRLRMTGMLFKIVYSHAKSAFDSFATSVVEELHGEHKKNEL